jgi:methylaspartate mutase epsilon subunit
MEPRVRNKKWDEERFLKERKEVLAQWPTGKEVDFDEAVEYHQRLPEHKRFGNVMQNSMTRQDSRIHRAGTPVLEQKLSSTRSGEQACR